MWLFLILLSFLLTFEESLQVGTPYNTSTLKFVHVVFRHGDRTPDSYCSYFNPAVNDTFWPDGFGALTMLGKNQEHDIGTYLRGRYNSWLGNIYYPDVLSARSTDYPRTKMSLQLVLAGLFPPVPEQTWNWNIYWQPIPYIYPTGTDTLMGYPLLCPNFQKEFDRVFNSSEVKNMLKSKKMLFNFINKYSKPLSSNPVINVYYLYNCLYTWDNLNIPLPNWLKLIYPQGTKHAAMIMYTLNTYNSFLTKLSGGQLLGRVLTDASAIAGGTFTPTTQKISLFSGHEYNVAHLLRALRSFDPPQWPNYGSFVLFELHQINGKYGFKMFFQNYEAEDPLPIVIPGCEEFCPIDKVKSILVDSIPDFSVANFC